MAQTKHHASLKESVLDRIRKDIITGELPPGTVIRDNELATRYGVSTSPIREALIHLASERLVDMPANRPKRVSPIDPREARDLFAVFRLVALNTFAWGAARMTPDRLDRLQQALDGMRMHQASGDPYSFLKQSSAFFQAAYEAADNREATTIIQHYLYRIERLVLLVEIENFPQSIHDTELLYQALVAGDAAAAIRIHSDTLEAVGRHLDAIAVPSNQPEPVRRAARKRPPAGTRQARSPVRRRTPATAS